MIPDYSVPHSVGGPPPDDPDQHLACMLRHLLDAVAGMETLHRSHLERLARLEDEVALARPGWRELSSASVIVQPPAGREGA